MGKALPIARVAMSTARNRFGVSILVGLALAVLCTVQDSVRAAQPEPASYAFAEAEGDGMFSIDRVMSAASSRTQIAIGLGAGVPMLLIGMMVRRRNQADY